MFTRPVAEPPMQTVRSGAGSGSISAVCLGHRLLNRSRISGRSRPSICDIRPARIEVGNGSRLDDPGHHRFPDNVHPDRDPFGAGCVHPGNHRSRARQQETCDLRRKGFCDRRHRRLLSGLLLFRSDHCGHRYPEYSSCEARGERGQVAYSDSDESGGCGNMRALAGNNLVHENLSTGTRNGYRFSVSGNASDTNGCEIKATPLSPSEGTRSFYYSSVDGVFRVQSKGGAANYSSPPVDSESD
jgi:hypothetical protein